MKGDKALTKSARFQHSGETTRQIHISGAQNFRFFYSHALVLFGGIQGLEYSLECDENLKADNIADLCDLYLDLCPGQGSRTIRTEVHQYAYINMTA